MGVTATYQGVWRDPGEETEGLYPGLVVHDGRQTGSITLGATRLPAWAIVADLMHGGWEHTADAYDIDPATHGGFDEAKFIAFVHNLLDLRGEFARLMLVLADAERRDSRRALTGPPWWERKGTRKSVADQLRRCLDVLDQAEAVPDDSR